MLLTTNIKQLQSYSGEIRIRDIENEELKAFIEDLIQTNEGKAKKRKFLTDCKLETKRSSALGYLLIFTSESTIMKDYLNQKKCNYDEIF